MNREQFREKFGYGGSFLDGAVLGEHAICGFGASSEAFSKYFPKEDLEEPVLVKKLVSTAIAFNHKGKYALINMEFVTKALEVLGGSLSNFKKVTFYYHKNEQREPLLLENENGAIMIAPRVEDSSHENDLSKAKKALENGQRGIFPNFETTDFTKVKGIGNHTAKLLVNNGIWSVKDLENASNYYLKSIKGIGMKTVERIKNGL